MISNVFSMALLGEVIGILLLSYFHGGFVFIHTVFL